ncbi:hypothetical protein BD779DRAFT_1484766 [Infundibulicybe gibba]|nr:hypothetical protein BD779DRAFT_1484766 [Infundibulicybe gibba]
MPPLPSKKSLENMKRADLQKLCKDYGVKANLKTEALIDLLLDTQKPAPRSTPATQLTRRSVSTRRSSRTGGSRISSGIVHDTDEEDEAESEGGQGDDCQPQEPPPVLPPLVTRTRKAKETQTRLGVGKPVAAGGSGPRAVTKSMSVSRGKRGKGSRSLKPTEATIPEEEPEPAEPPQSLPRFQAHNSTYRDLSAGAGGSLEVSLPHLPNESHEVEVVGPTTLRQTSGSLAGSSLASLAGIDKIVADALRPLHEQMQSLKSELEHMHSLKAELHKLKSQVVDLGVLQEKVHILTTEVDILKRAAIPEVPLSTDKHQNTNTAAGSQKGKASKSAGLVGLGVPSVLQISAEVTGASGSHSSGDLIPEFPHPTLTLLGKRHRDSISSDVTGVVDADEEVGLDEAERAKTVFRPTKKRPKISPSIDTPNQDDIGERTEEQQVQQTELGQETMPRVPSFSVFGGFDESLSGYIDPPPPTNRLPDYFNPPSPTDIDTNPTRATTSTANGPENQNPFGFSFLPPTSTPTPSLFNFPYPEPPQSPSPARNTSGPSNPRQGERSDIFQHLGLPPTSRSQSGLEDAGGMDASINPSALMRRASDRDKDADVSSNEVAIGLGLTAVKTSSGPDTVTADIPSIKRTMYGTELEGDKRFGDFGVEGVATGFWAGGRY